MELKILQTGGVIISGKTNGVLVDPKTPSDYPKNRVVIYPLKIDSEAVLAEGQIVLAGPGSYEVGGIEIAGTSVSEGAGTIYVANVDGVDVAIVPGLQVALSDKKVERLEEIGVDVCVLLPGKLGQKVLVETAKRIGANYIVFTTKNVTEVENAVTLEVLKVEQDTLPEGSEVVVLTENV